MRTKRNRTPDDAGARPRSRGGADDRDFWEDDGARNGRGSSARSAGDPGGRSSPHHTAQHAEAAQADGHEARGWRNSDVISPAGTPVAFRTPTGWRVGGEEVSDLTSAMVLADLIAADLPAGGPPPAGPPPAGPPPASPPPARQQRRGGSRAEPEDEELDPRKLQETVAQLEHALRVRVRVEQAIGVLAERHRLRPRQAFELLRSAARVRGRRVLEVAAEVVDSATNPLLRIPEELARPPAPRRRGRVGRHSFSTE